MSPALDTIAVAVFPAAEADNAARVAGFGDVRVLSDGRAFEWDARHTQDELAERLPGVDVAVVPKANRLKRLLICDMDSTLIGQECIDELADFAGVKAEVSAITERAMQGEIGFEGALRERVALLEGLPESVVEECYGERIRLNPGARVLAMTMRGLGAKTVIVSGGFTVFSKRVAEAAGFEVHQANELLFEDGRFTGRVSEPILGRETKHDALLTHSDGRPEDAVAVGDGANDLAMIQAAGMGVAYYAKPAVAAAAGCAVNFTDLASVLFFQGVRDDQFVR